MNKNFFKIVALSLICLGIFTFVILMSGEQDPKPMGSNIQSISIQNV